MTEPTTAAGQLREWLAWARERVAGVPQPSIVDRIEAEARQQDASALREALEGLWPVIDKWMPRKALVEMPRSDLDAFEKARKALAALPPSAPAGNPEDTCGRCGGPNLATWHAPSPLWNAVMRQNDGPEPFNGIVCPRCFGELAQEAGVADHFCVTTHDAKVVLPSVFGDGRVWDAARCMWVEPPSAARLEQDR